MDRYFGSTIRRLREEQNLFLRQVASQLDMDTALLSKIENGSRQIKKEQVGPLAVILNADKDELLTLWLADQVYQVLEGEQLLALKAIRLAEENIKFKTTKRSSK